MSVWRNIADAVLEGVGDEFRWRRENPDKAAEMFREREKFWLSRGRRGLARIAARRARRWERRAEAKGCP